MGRVSRLTRSERKRLKREIKKAPSGARKRALQKQLLGLRTATLDRGKLKAFGQAERTDPNIAKRLVSGQAETVEEAERQEAFAQRVAQRTAQRKAEEIQQQQLKEKTQTVSTQQVRDGGVNQRRLQATRQLIQPTQPSFNLFVDDIQPDLKGQGTNISAIPKQVIPRDKPQGELRAAPTIKTNFVDVLFRRAEEAEQRATFKRAKGESGFFEEAKAFGLGVVGGVSAPLVNFFTRPIQTAKATVKSVINPKETLQQLGEQLKTSPSSTVGGIAGQTLFFAGASKVTSKIATKVSKPKLVAERTTTQRIISDVSGKKLVKDISQTKATVQVGRQKFKVRAQTLGLAEQIKGTDRFVTRSGTGFKITQKGGRVTTGLGKTKGLAAVGKESFVSLEGVVTKVKGKKLTSVIGTKGRVAKIPKNVEALRQINIRSTATTVKGKPIEFAVGRQNLILQQIEGTTTSQIFKSEFFRTSKVKGLKLSGKTPKARKTALQRATQTPTTTTGTGTTQFKLEFKTPPPTSAGTQTAILTAVKGISKQPTFKTSPLTSLIDVTPTKTLKGTTGTGLLVKPKITTRTTPKPRIISKPRAEVISLPRTKPSTITRTIKTPKAATDILSKTTTTTVSKTLQAFKPQTQTTQKALTKPAIAPKIPTTINFVTPKTIAGFLSFKPSKKAVSRREPTQFKSVFRRDTPTLFASLLQLRGERTRFGIKSGVGLRLLQTPSKKKKKKKARLSIFSRNF